MKIRDALFALLVVMIAAIGLYLIKGDGVEKITADQLAKKINQDLKAPRMLDDEVRLDGIVAVGNAVEFKATLVNFNQFTIPSTVKRTLDRTMRRWICAGFDQDPKMTQGMKKSHLELSFKYYNSTGMILYGLTMMPEDC